MAPKKKAGQYKAQREGDMRILLKVIEYEIKAQIKWLHIVLRNFPVTV